jgi:zinc transport system substrate-binding protein
MFSRLLFLLILFSSSLCASPKVIVSIAPTKFLVERIAGNLVTVEKFVPAGASPHSYEPTSRQLLSAAQGTIWFRIGEGFENKAIGVIASKMKVVNLRDGLNLLASCCCHRHDPYDPHIWLSPKLLKQQAVIIAQTLKEELPDHQAQIESNLNSLQAEIDAIDREIRLSLKEGANYTVLVTHPAFGYFCHDYGITQLSIEVEGKEPTPKQMTELLLLAKKQNIRKVFLEPQHSTKGGLRMATELGAEVIWLDPYKEEVLENLRDIAKAFIQ